MKMTPTPAERFELVLAGYPQHEREDDSGATVRNWTPEQYAAAFHRMVVDHAIEKFGGHFGRLEGRSVSAQAEIICEMLDCVEIPW